MLTVGKFTLEGSDLSGPAAYMEARGFALLDRIDAGQDATFNRTAHLSPSVEMAVLVRLQADYDDWLSRQGLRRRPA
jgi:hypothetical protein